MFSIFSHIAANAANMIGIGKDDKSGSRSGSSSISVSGSSSNIRFRSSASDTAVVKMTNDESEKAVEAAAVAALTLSTTASGNDKSPTSTSPRSTTTTALVQTLTTPKDAHPAQCDGAHGPNPTVAALTASAVSSTTGLRLPSGDSPATTMGVNGTSVASSRPKRQVRIEAEAKKIEEADKQVAIKFQKVWNKEEDMKEKEVSKETSSASASVKKKSTSSASASALPPPLPTRQMPARKGKGKVDYYSLTEEGEGEEKQRTKRHTGKKRKTKTPDEDVVEDVKPTAKKTKTDTASTRRPQTSNDPPKPTSSVKKRKSKNFGECDSDSDYFDDGDDEDVRDSSVSLKPVPVRGGAASLKITAANSEGIASLKSTASAVTSKVKGKRKGYTSFNPSADGEGTTLKLKHSTAAATASQNKGDTAAILTSTADEQSALLPIQEARLLSHKKAVINALTKLTSTSKDENNKGKGYLFKELKSAVIKEIGHKAYKSDILSDIMRDGIEVGYVVERGFRYTLGKSAENVMKELSKRMAVVGDAGKIDVKGTKAENKKVSNDVLANMLHPDNINNPTLHQPQIDELVTSTGKSEKQVKTLMDRLRREKFTQLVGTWKKKSYEKDGLPIEYQAAMHLKLPNAEEWKNCTVPRPVTPQNIKAGEGVPEYLPMKLSARIVHSKDFSEKAADKSERMKKEMKPENDPNRDHCFTLNHDCYFEFSATKKLIAMARDSEDNRIHFNRETNGKNAWNGLRMTNAEDVSNEAGFCSRIDMFMAFKRSGSGWRNAPQNDNRVNNYSDEREYIFFHPEFHAGMTNETLRNNMIRSLT